MQNNQSSGPSIFPFHCPLNFYITGLLSPTLCQWVQDPGSPQVTTHQVASLGICLKSKVIQGKSWGFLT
jgi:hypothetical protein